MIEITSAQLDRLAGGQDERFVHRVAHWAVQKPPVASQGLSHEDLVARVRTAIGRGKSIGLKRESSLASFATLSLTFGPDFDRHPDIARIMQEPDDTPDKRWLRVPAAVPQASWASFKGDKA